MTGQAEGVEGPEPVALVLSQDEENKKGMSNQETTDEAQLVGGTKPFQMSNSIAEILWKSRKHSDISQ